MNRQSTHFLALPDTAAYEIAWITILSLALKQGQGDELSVGDREDLVAVAESCPADVGSAWQEVVSFMPAEDAAPFWGRETDEDCVGERTRPAVDPAEAKALLLSPNPAGHWLSATLPERAGGDWALRDWSGQLVRQGRVAPEQVKLRLDLGAFASGIYSLQFISAQGERFEGRVSIVK